MYMHMLTLSPHLKLIVYTYRSLSQTQGGVLRMGMTYEGEESVSCMPKIRFILNFAVGFAVHVWVGLWNRGVYTCCLHAFAGAWAYASAGPGGASAGPGGVNVGFDHFQQSSSSAGGRGAQFSYPQQPSHAQADAYGDYTATYTSSSPHTSKGPSPYG